MKHILLLLPVTLLLAGCMIAIGNGNKPDSNPSPAAYYAAAMQGAPAIPEIDAAGALSFDSSRSEQLRAIAARPNLLPLEQVHLVYVTMRKLDFDSGRETVLMDLIHNPCFSREAKSAILMDLPRFSFDSSRSKLMTEMQGRPAAVPTTQAASVGGSAT